MRLFAAVDPPAAVLDELATLLGERDERLRYVPLKQWHLTTAFYGEVADATVPDLLERLGRAAARCSAMTLCLQGAGTFGRARNARVMWVGVDGDVDELSRLAERCVAAGRRSGLVMEDRRYRPHLTLARARGEPLDLTSHVESLSAYRSDVWDANELRLVRSTLGSHVRHETLATYPLTG